MKTYTAEEIADITDVVYRIQLARDHQTNVKRMLDKDREADPTDTGGRLHRRAKFYAPAVTATLQAIGLMEPDSHLKQLLAEGLAGPMVAPK